MPWAPFQPSLGSRCEAKKAEAGVFRFRGLGFRVMLLCQNYWDNGKEYGNYRNYRYRDYMVYIGGIYQGYMGIMEKENGNYYIIIGVI